MEVRFKMKYGYNYRGFWGAAINKPIKRKDNKYYCSEFIKEIFERFGIEGTEVLGKIPHPIDFLNLPCAKRIYTGKLSEYTCDTERKTELSHI